MSLAMEVNRNKEKVLRRSFFQCNSIGKGLAAAATELNMSVVETRSYFMNYLPSAIDVYTLYVYACRYKLLHEVGMKVKEISAMYNLHRSCISRAMKVANTFAPNQIESTLAFSDYITAAKEKDPVQYLNEIRNQKIAIRTVPFSVNRPTHRSQYTSQQERKAIFLENAKRAKALKGQGKTTKEIALELGTSQSEASILHRVGEIPHDVLEGPVSIAEIKNALKTIEPVKYLKSVKPQVQYMIPAQDKDWVDEPEKACDRKELRSFAEGILALIESEQRARIAIDLYKVTIKMLEEDNKMLQNQLSDSKLENRQLKQNEKKQKEILQKHQDAMQVVKEQVNKLAIV